jgi:hypothetical protein
MAVELRERWTEESVAALPAGEHDFFDRKSGAMLSDSGFRRDFAKAISAFANSGGGHLLIGVADDGSFDGVEPNRGRTTTREWLEQLIPDSVADALRHFRVHVVERSSASQIPGGRDVIVVDVGDSAFAPHQSRVDSTYYWRAGGHSRPAPHFYLESLRRRFVTPVLEPTLVHVRPFACFHTPEGIFAQFRAKFSVQNQGRVATSKWALIPDFAGGPSTRLGDFCLRDLPQWTLSPREGLLQRDATLFPTYHRDFNVLFGLKLRVMTPSATAIQEALDSLLTPDLRLRVVGVSEFPPNDSKEWTIRSHLPADTPQLLHWMLPGDRIVDQVANGGRGIICNGLGFPLENPGSSYRELQGSVHNNSDVYYSSLVLLIRFKNSGGHVVAREEIRIENLPPQQRKRFTESVRAFDVEARESADVIVMDCSGRHADGKAFASIFEF